MTPLIVNKKEERKGDDDERADDEDHHHHTTVHHATVDLHGDISPSAWSPLHWEAALYTHKILYRGLESREGQIS